MTDIPMSTMEPGTRPSLPPPVMETGVIGWMRHNLFSTWFDAILTVLAIGAIYLIVPPFLSWAVFDASWSYPPEVLERHALGAVLGLQRQCGRLLDFCRLPPAAILLWLLS